MSSEKRPASDEPGAGQLVVKRQKPGTSTALARRDGSETGALIPSVRITHAISLLEQEADILVSLTIL